MGLTVQGFTSNALPYKLIMDDGASQAAAVAFRGNVTGTSGSLFSLNVVNISTAMYIKVWLGAAAALGDDPDIKIELASGATEELIIPSGVPFTELSFMVTQTSASGNSQTAPGNGVAVNIVTS